MMMVDQFFFVCGYWLAYFANQFFFYVYSTVIYFSPNWFFNNSSSSFAFSYLTSDRANFFINFSFRND